MKKLGAYSVNIENETIKNQDYRRVLFTSTYQQLVLMNLKPGEDIPLETHSNIDQFIRIEKGTGIAIVGTGDEQQKYNLSDGITITIPAEIQHYINNTSDTEDLKLYTIYSPPEHPDGRIDQRQPKEESQSGGIGMREKYLKYKTKYLRLKNANRK